VGELASSGVVGWVRLDAPEEAARQLEGWLAEPGFCGVRHLVHDHPATTFWRSLPSACHTRGGAAAGIAFDVPDA
jgi:L-fuconolactonase